LNLGLGTTHIVNHLSQKTDGFENWFRPVFWVWAALLVLSVVGPVYHGWKSVGVPAELDYGEGPLMWQVQNVWDQTKSYGSLESGPLVIWNYPPAYLLAVRAVWRLEGDLLWSGRFVSYLSGLGVEFLLAAIIYGALPQRFGRWVRICAAGTGLLFLCTGAAFLWLPLMRVDWLGLLATYLGVFLFVSAREKHWKAYLAFACFFVAAYTKQTFLAAPIACFLAALAVAPRRALRLGLLLVVSGGAVFWLCMVWTYGGFARHLILYNVHKFSVGRALSGVTTNLADVRLFFVPLGVLVVVAVSRARWAGFGRSLKMWKARLRRSPLSMALVVEMMHWFLSFLLSFSYGKSGATFNYFLESNAALCVVAGLVLGILLWEVKRVPRVTATVALVLVIPLVLAGQNLYTVVNSFVPGELVRMHQVEQMEAYRQFTPRLLSASKPVLSDDMVLLMRAGKDLVFEPATMCLMAEVGTWDLSGFERRMESGDFGVIIVSRADIWDPRLLAALRKAYQLDGTRGRYQLYRPR
jgi:hypothetical protein